MSLGGKSEDSFQQKFNRKRGLGSSHNQCGTLSECEVGLGVRMDSTCRDGGEGGSEHRQPWHCAEEALV